jgi:hypothetical protein
MTRRALLTIASVALVVLGFGQVASAQRQFDFTIPNAFVANGKPFVPGDYMISVNPATDLVTVTSKTPKGGSAMLVVETRVAERASVTAPEVVFDKLNGQLILSELLVPGEDGYLVAVTKAKHTHESVKGTGGKK